MVKPADFSQGSAISSFDSNINEALKHSVQRIVLLFIPIVQLTKHLSENTFSID